MSERGIGRGERDEILALARQAFPAFYARAAIYEAEMFDQLVVAHAATVMMSDVLKLPPQHSLRGPVERAASKTEQLFHTLREHVRDSSAFQNASLHEQSEIEKVVFEIPVI